MENIPAFFPLLFLHFQRARRSFYAVLSCIFLCLLAYNCAAIFCTHVPVPVPDKQSLSPATFLSENVVLKTRTFTSLQYSVEEDGPRENSKALLVKNQNSTRIHRGRRHWRHAMKVLQEHDEVKRFRSRVASFFKTNSHSSCKFRFFMTWISSAESFGDREMFCLESVFKAHPDGCLIIVSNAMDTKKGKKVLRPFSDRGFRVTAISPDFNYLFKGTSAHDWYNRLKRGQVNPGEVSLGQNLSNLLRMGLLYKFGGIYLDTDVVVMRSFTGLRNAIGAQTVDLITQKWSRLNNAVMVFDAGHPLSHEFIEEFAQTFDGNKWGHNGPYLVSRVVSRVRDRAGFDFTVLPPMAFYPVDWSKIHGLFHGARSLDHSKWIIAKLRQIRSQSFALHLWNKQSRGFKVEKGSIVQHVLFSTCVVCNFSSL